MGLYDNFADYGADDVFANGDRTTVSYKNGDNVVEAKSIMKQTYEIKKDHVKEEIQRPNLEGVKTYTLEELNKKYNNIES